MMEAAKLQRSLMRAAGILVIGCSSCSAEGRSALAAVPAGPFPPRAAVMHAQHSQAGYLLHACFGFSSEKEQQTHLPFGAKRRTEAR